MKILDELKREHGVVDGIAGALHHWAHRGAEHPDAADDRRDLVTVLRVVMLDHHHLNEEVLFRALVEHGEIPGHHGPLMILRKEHEATGEAIDRFETRGLDEGAAEIARSIAAELWQHMDKEDSVLLPEAERRLIDGGIRNLEPLAVSDDVQAALDLAEELLQRLPPMDDPDLIRGDGCIPCRAFGDTCHGIETEWWSDWEREHYAGLDEG